MGFRSYPRFLAICSTLTLALTSAALPLNAQRSHARSAPPKPAALTPLSPRDRVVQLLDRFTFGARPGEVDRVLAQGADKWLDQQMDPASIKDSALNHRLNDYPTLHLTAAEALAAFPDRYQITQVADGKVDPPTDPLLAAVYQVQMYKLAKERDLKKPGPDGQPKPEPTDAEKAAQKQQDQATAARIAGELFALPKQQRMPALIKMSVVDRAAFCGNGNLAPEQRNQLIGDFNPREREAFYAMSANINSSYFIANELQQARILRDVLSERQLEQVMTTFWFNHFNVYISKDSDNWYTTSYERDVIRKHALGNFRELLLATAQSPAMLVYLDNWLSIGPDSIANGVDPSRPKLKRGNKGLNENYGREVMELHTVGVNGGYTQADVTSLSAILTGWGIDQPQLAGGFKFDPRRHEPGTKTWFGYAIDDEGHATRLAPGEKLATDKPKPGEVATEASINQGTAALEILARAPQTAHFISYLLAQYFVADHPPATLVDRLAKSFTDSDGDIKTVLRALIDSPEFNSRQYFRNKVKTPEEFVASAFRATATDPQNPGAVVNTVRSMGMELYRAVPPTGYYLTADQWMNSTALVDRLNFAYQLTNGKFANQKFDAPRLLAMGLLSPSTDDVTGSAHASGVSAPAPRPSAPKMLGVAASEAPDMQPVQPLAPGARLAMHVLERTMIEGAVSAQTNQLIEKQMTAQPTGNPADELNVLTALIMGSPEFQVR